MAFAEEQELAKFCARQAERIDELLTLLDTIATRLAPSNKTFDELIREADICCDLARSARQPCPPTSAIRE